MKSDNLKHLPLVTKWVFSGIVLFLVVVGCKPNGQVIANNVVEPEEVLITGQIFIVTKSRANVVLGDEKVALLNEQNTREYFNSRVFEWSNDLVTAKIKLDSALVQYEALFKDDLVKFNAAHQYHQQRVFSAELGSQEHLDAQQWEGKTREKIKEIYRLKQSSEQKLKLDTAFRTQERLWEEINWPSVEYFSPNIQVSTTDSEGRFKFIIPKSLARLNLLLFAKADRLVGDEQERYWWMVKCDLSGGKTTESVLSNKSRDSVGVTGWFDSKSFQVFLSKYWEEMQSVKEAYDRQQQIDKINYGL